MKDKTPIIFRYIRLMQEHTPCVTEWRYTDKDGKEVPASLEECIKQNQENGAEYSSVGVFCTDLKHLIDVPQRDLPKVREGNIEIKADERTKAHVEKMIRQVVAEVEEPQPIESIDISQCNSPEEALAELKERNKQITAYRDYVESCNSIRLLYNLLTPEVRNYLIKQNIIAEAGRSIDYYQDIAKCRNLMKKGCEKIIVSVKNGTISNIQLVGRNGKDVYDIPLLDKRTDVLCRIDMDLMFRCMIGGESFPEMNTALQILNSFVDPKDKWTDVKNMSFPYVADSDYLYTFAEVRDNVAEYLKAESKYEIREKNTFTQDICRRLECLYRYLRNEIKLDKTEAWEFICNLWNLQDSNGDVHIALLRYLGYYQKELPISFTIKH